MKEWNVTGEVIIGLSHLADNTPGQDKVEIYAPKDDKNGMIAAALADGVGSLENSHIAAKLATASTVAWLRENADRLFDGQLEDETKKDAQRLLLGGELLGRIRSNIREQAERQQLDIKSLDCNLAFILIDPKRNKALVGQLGDCAICVICDDTNKRVSTVISDRGGLANSTCTVFSTAANDRLRMGILSLANERIQGFILTSDGMEGVLYRKNSKFVCKQAEYCFNKLYDKQDNAGLRKLLEDAQDQSGGYLDDDISVIVLSRAKKPVHLAEDPYWTCECGTRNSVAGSRCINCHADLLQIYRNVDFSQYESIDAYFEEENRKEKQQIQVRERKKVGNAAGVKSEKHAASEVVQGYDKNYSTPDKEKEAGRKAASGRNARRAEPEKKKKEVNLGLMGEKVQKREAQEPEVQNDVVGKNKGTSNKNPRSRGSYQEDYEEESDYSMKLILGIGLIVVLCLTVFIFWKWFNGLEKPVDPEVNRPPVAGTTAPAETSDAFETTEGTVPREPHVPVELGGEVLLLPDGSVYYGEINNDDLPDGYGTHFVDEYVFTGTFEDGVKNGEFVVATRTEETARISVVIFEDNEIVETLYDNTTKEEEPVYEVAWNLRTLRERPGYNSDETSVGLKKGTRVYPTGNRIEDVDGTNWIEIRTEDDVVGWCEENAVRLVVAPESVDQGTITG